MKKRTRILYIDGNTLYAQIGNRLCMSVDDGKTWQIYFLMLPSGARAYSRIHARIARRGLHCVKVWRNGNLLLVGKQAIYLYGNSNGKAFNFFAIPRGSRPLFICENKDGDLFWGEYFRNPKRDEVNIYVSRDQARSWRIGYRFEKNKIRHVHGVFCDPHDDRIWLTTGDEDHESGIWVTDDKFRTLEKVIDGDQHCRALQLLFTNENIYFGTDTPFERNHIYKLDKSTGKIEELTPVDSSVYWGCKVGDSIFFSTAVEPSGINMCKFTSIWGSRDGRQWRKVAKYKSDFWPMKYFQVGQIYLPQGNNTTDYLFYTPIATESDQTLQRIRVANLFAEAYDE